MNNARKIKDDLYWIGVNDRRLSLFENVFPIPRGVSYNSYLLKDEKNVLIDTVDTAVFHQFFENIEFLLGKENLDYLIVNHMEPDHCSLIMNVMEKYPDIKLICTSHAQKMINQFFENQCNSNIITVKEGDSISFGKHNYTFYMAPMVHWPEVMVTYDNTDNILFSADAFGTFGAINGNLFADEVNFERDWLDDARRYYSNIVGKFGPQVQTLLKKAAGLKIETICPLHGLIWRKNISYFIDKYNKWSRYEAEDDNILIIYGSMYGNTESAVNIVASKLAEAGEKNITIYDVSSTDVSILISEVFRCSRIILAAPSYNGGLYTPMENFLTDLKIHNIQNRTFGIIENGSWAVCSGKIMMSIINEMNNNIITESVLTIKSALKNCQIENLNNFITNFITKN